MNDDLRLHYEIIDLNKKRIIEAIKKRIEEITNGKKTFDYSITPTSGGLAFIVDRDIQELIKEILEKSTLAKTKVEDYIETDSFEDFVNNRLDNGLELKDTINSKKQNQENSLDDLLKNAENDTKKDIKNNQKLMEENKEFREKITKQIEEAEEAEEEMLEGRFGIKLF